MNPLNVLAFSSLFPNSQQPGHGIFLEHRLKHLVATNNVALRVIAPIPWFPFRHHLFGRYSRFASIPFREIRSGIDVSHPRYISIPKAGMTLSPLTMAIAGLRAFRKLRSSGFDPDVIDAYYLYPDCVAATIVGQVIGKPMVHTAFGSDVSQIPEYILPKRMILWAINLSYATTAVCNALKAGLERLGADGKKINVIEHGVDLDLFHPLERHAAGRVGTGQNNPVVLSVGHLIERKGHDLAIRAIAEVPEAQLLIIGSGPEEGKLKALITELGLEERVRLLGQLPQQSLPRFFSTADVFLLCSHREGIANVILESLACGTPVAATDVWGSSEVLTTPDAGALIFERTPQAVADTIRKLIYSPPAGENTRHVAERYSWQSTARQHFSVLQKSVRQHAKKNGRATGYVSNGL